MFVETWRDYTVYVRTAAIRTLLFKLRLCCSCFPKKPISRIYIFHVSSRNMFDKHRERYAYYFYDWFS